MHLSNDELYKLAELTFENQPYDQIETEQMKHLKTCKECFEKFCAALTMIEITSEAGYAMMYEKPDPEKLISEKILAVVSVIKKHINRSAETVMEQIEKAGSALCFRAPLMLGTRGVGAGSSSVLKLEDIKSEKTFIMLDTERKELLVQIDSKFLGTDMVKVFLTDPDGDRTDIPVVKKGNIISGLLKNVPDADFEICIEKV